MTAPHRTRSEELGQLVAATVPHGYSKRITLNAAIDSLTRKAKSEITRAMLDTGIDWEHDQEDIARPALIVFRPTSELWYSDDPVEMRRNYLLPRFRDEQTRLRRDGNMMAKVAARTSDSYAERAQTGLQRMVEDISKLLFAH